MVYLTKSTKKIITRTFNLNYATVKHVVFEDDTKIISNPLNGKTLS